MSLNRNATYRCRGQIEMALNQHNSTLFNGKKLRVRNDDDSTTILHSSTAKDRPLMMLQLISSTDGSGGPAWEKLNVLLNSLTIRPYIRIGKSQISQQ
uniref:Uncharacterized protein n=1 Tax=Romanomermis culicivorax TaxID=13658 RepID=A0A915JPC8_ROMCU